MRRHLWFWETWAILGGGLFFFFFRMGGYWSATWLCKWSFLISASSVCLSVWAAKRTSFLYLPCLLYTFLSLAALSSWPSQPYGSLIDSVSLLALQKNAFFGLAEFTTVIMLILSVQSERAIQAWLMLPAVIWVIGTGAVLCQPWTGPYSSPNNGLWFGNPSMGGSLLACILPLFWCQLKLYAPTRFVCGLLIITSWILTFIAVLKTHASIPWGVLGVVTAGFFVARKPLWKLWKPVVGLSVLAVLMIQAGERLLGIEFWLENGRFSIWRMAWRWFHDHGSPLWGMGFSSSQILLPLEQVITGNYKGDYFLWLHSDWLQLLIEGGWVGFACVLLACGRVLYKAWAYPVLFSCLVGFATMALFNYPLRMPIHCLVLAIAWGAVEAFSSAERQRSPGSISVSKTA